MTTSSKLAGAISPCLDLFSSPRMSSDGVGLHDLLLSLIHHSFRAREARVRESHHSAYRQVPVVGPLGRTAPKGSDPSHVLPVHYVDDDICTSARPPVSEPVRLQTPSDLKKRHSILTPYFITRCFHRPAFQRWPLSGSVLFQHGTQSILLALPSQAGCEFHFQSVLSRVYFPH